MLLDDVTCSLVPTPQTELPFFIARFLCSSSPSTPLIQLIFIMVSFIFYFKVHSATLSLISFFSHTTFDTLYNTYYYYIHFDTLTPSSEYHRTTTTLLQLYFMRIYISTSFLLPLFYLHPASIMTGGGGAGPIAYFKPISFFYYRDHRKLQCLYHCYEKSWLVFG